MDFRIIAVKPLRGCSKDALKILKPGTTYYFLNEYEIRKNSINHIQSLPDNFFSRGYPTISVSAIVGKNGSGKSSLIELIMQAINNLSKYLEVGGDVEWINGLKLELYIQTDSYYKIVFGRKISLYKQGQNERRFRAVSKKEFTTANFFYSIVVNYSHYGLNSRDVGDWLDNLFHKNDGYQTPIVINPMRSEGIIDINNENALVKSRLISNILRPDVKDITHLTDNLLVNHIRLKLKKFEDRVLYTWSRTIERGGQFTQRPRPVRFSNLYINHDQILRLLNKKYYFGYRGDWGKGNYVNNLAYKYIINKLVKIAITYRLYSPYFDKEKMEFVPGKLEQYVDMLFGKNENHISFKLKQTLNFLKHRHLRPKGHRPFKLNIKRYSRFIGKTIATERHSPERIIELIPPPIFEVELLLSPEFKSRPIVKFSSLSSGEKQLIYSINSILYHLANLDSIRDNQFQRGYRFVNIMLEEVELYFHPNWQKNFINTLLKRVTEVSYKRIKGININLTTHSPFILSDIPNSNILFLTDGGPDQTAINVKTFGANIHDLLRYSFFLEDGSIGAFSKEKINEILQYINYRKLSDEITKIDRKEKLFIRAQKKLLNDLRMNLSEIKSANIDALVELIGEPLLQTKVETMWRDVSK